MNLFADLHIHSCLSPCGDNDMTLEQAAEYALGLVGNGMSKTEAAKLAAKESGLKKGDIYKSII